MEIFLIIIFSFIAATISGVAGFGGGLVLLPILTLFISPKIAIPILTIAQLFGNGSRVYFSYREIRWKMVLLFVSGAIPTAIIGSSLVVSFDIRILEVWIGIFLIAFVIYKRFVKKTFEINQYYLIVGGAFTGFISGLIGSAGPLGAAFFLAMRLPPLSYISSEALSALLIHITKIFIYQKYDLLTSKLMLTGLIAGIAMIAGSYCGKLILNKTPTLKIDLIIQVLMVLSALQLILK